MHDQPTRRRQYGAGSVLTYRGAWYGKWRIGDRQVKRKLGAKREPGSRDGITRKQAEARLRELMQAVRHAPAEERLTFEQAGSRYLHHLEHVMQRKPSTVADYRIMLRALARHFGAAAVERITADDIASYMAARSELAPKTIQNHIVFCHAVFAHAVKRGWTQSNPVTSVDRPRAIGANPDIRYLDTDEVEALIRAVDDDTLGATDRALYLTAAMTGLRQGELIALRWQDVDWPAALVRVRRSYTRGEWGTPKSRRSSRAVPMADRVAGELERHFQRSAFTADLDLVFAHPVLGTVLDASKLRDRFYTAMRSAGMGERCGRDGGITFHSMRHTFGTRMAAAGAPLRSIMEWMGHRDYSTTLIYADYAPDPTGGASFAERAFGGAGTTTGTNLSASGSKTEQQKPL